MRCMRARAVEEQTVQELSYNATRSLRKTAEERQQEQKHRMLEVVEHAEEGKSAAGQRVGHTLGQGVDQQEEHILLQGVGQQEGQSPVQGAGQRAEHSTRQEADQQGEHRTEIVVDGQLVPHTKG